MNYKFKFQTTDLLMSTYQKIKKMFTDVTKQSVLKSIRSPTFHKSHSTEQNNHPTKNNDFNLTLFPLTTLTDSLPDQD